MIGFLIGAVFVLYLLSRGSAQNAGALYPSTGVQGVLSSAASSASSLFSAVSSAASAQSILDSAELATAAGGGTGETSQPITMTAAEWATFKAQIIAKYVGSTPRGRYQQSTSYHAWYSACIDARQLLDLKTSEGEIPSGCGSTIQPGSLLAADLQARAVAGLGQVGAGAGLGIASNLGVSVPGAIAKAIPIVGAAVSLVTSAIAIFGAAHQAAMTKEKDYLCAYIPSANQALQLIDEQYRSGSIGGDLARQDLEALWRNWLNGISPIARPSATEYVSQLTSIGEGGTCNAACAFSLALRMIIDAREAVDY